MKRSLAIILIILSVAFLSGCVSENYSNGERIGLVTQFSNTGIIWKSWEGHLNLTQTGMNSASSEPFDFSIDNDHVDSTVVNTIKAAADSGWKVKLSYHEVWGKNWFENRGSTDHFITKVEVLDKNVVKNLLNSPNSKYGKTIDTIYVVVVDRASNHLK